MNLFQSSVIITALVLVFTSCKKDKITKPDLTPVVNSIQNYFKFDGNLNDSSGKLTTIVPSGTITYAMDRKGNVAGAVYFDGTSTKVVYPGLELEGKSMTIALWVKYASLGGGVKYYLSAMNNNGGPALYQVMDVLGAAISLPGTNSVPGISVDINWHHFAVTYDGTEMRSYVDGVFAKAINHPGTMGTGIRDLILGNHSGIFWQGTIDDLRIYNKAMTAADIQKIAAL